MRNPEHFIPPRDATALVVVDIQERFFPAMEGERKDTFLENTKILLQFAKPTGACALEQLMGILDTLPVYTLPRQVPQELLPGLSDIALHPTSRWPVGNGHISLCLLRTSLGP